MVRIFIYKNQICFFLLVVELHVFCNGNLLDANKYEIADKILSFETLECSSNKKDLEILIVNTVDINNQIEFQDFKIPYQKHGKSLSRI